VRSCCHAKYCQSCMEEIRGLHCFGCGQSGNPRGYTNDYITSSLVVRIADLRDNFVYGSVNVESYVKEVEEISMVLGALGESCTLKMVTNFKAEGSTSANPDNQNFNMNDEPQQGPSSKISNITEKAAEPLIDDKQPGGASPDGSTGMVQPVVTVPNNQSPLRKDQEFMEQGTPLKEGNKPTVCTIASDEELFLSPVAIAASPEVLSLTPPKQIRPLFSKLSRNVKGYNEKRMRPISETESENDEQTPPAKKKMDEPKTNLGIAKLSESFVGQELLRCAANLAVAASNLGGSQRKSQKPATETSPSLDYVVEKRIISLGGGGGAFRGSLFGNRAAGPSATKSFPNVSDFLGTSLSYDGPSTSTASMTGGYKKAPTPFAVPFLPLQNKPRLGPAGASLKALAIRHESTVTRPGKGHVCFGQS